MRKDQLIEDAAKNLISQEMARSSHFFNQNFETPGCLTKLSSSSTAEAKEDNGNQLEPECIVSTTPCQTSRECQTRSTELLKKPSMNQRSTPTASAKQLKNWICLSVDLRMRMKRSVKCVGNQDKAESRAVEVQELKEATFQPNPRNQLCAPQTD